MHATIAHTGASALLPALGACAAGAAPSSTSMAGTPAEGLSFAQQLGRHSAVGAALFDLLESAPGAGPLADAAGMVIAPPLEGEHAADRVATPEPATADTTEGTEVAGLQTFIAQLLPVAAPAALSAGALASERAGSETPGEATQATPTRPTRLVPSDPAAPLQAGAAAALAQTPTHGTTPSERASAVPARERGMARAEAPAGPGAPATTRTDPGEPRAKARGDARASERHITHGTAPRHQPGRDSINGVTRSDAATSRANLAREAARTEETDRRHALDATALPTAGAVTIDAAPGGAATPASPDARFDAAPRDHNLVAAPGSAASAPASAALASANAGPAPPPEALLGTSPAAGAPAGPRSRLERLDHGPTSHSMDPTGPTSMTAPALAAQARGVTSASRDEGSAQGTLRTAQDRAEPKAPHDPTHERSIALPHAAQALMALTEPQGVPRPASSRTPSASTLNDVLALPAVAAALPNAAQISQMPTVHIELGVPVSAPQFRDAFALQVSLLTRDGVQHAQVHLNPAELGPISVQIALDGQQAQIHFGCDSAQTRQLVETGLPTLAAHLRDAGFTLSGGGVSQHAPEQRQGSNPGAAERAAALALDRDDAAATPTLHTIRVATGRLDTYA